MLRKLFLTGVLGAAFLLAGAGTAQADNDRNCGNRIRNEEYKLQRDVQKHGLFSRQAQHRREKIQQLRRQCRAFGWDRDRDRWGRDGRWDRDDRRWDRRDRDRDSRWRRDRDRDRDRNRSNWYWDGRNWRRR